MTYCFHALICLCLISFQTAVMPFLLPCHGCYDLLVPFVLHMGIRCPVREALPVIVVLGFVADNLSAGPFGTYQAAYVWILLGTKWLLTFLHVRRNHFLLPLVVVMGILLENMVILGTFAISDVESRLPADAASIVGGQVVWGMTTGTLLLILIGRFAARWDRWTGERLAGKNRARKP